MFLHAQHPYSWNLSVEDGLPSLEVYDLYQDTKGYMWIGTDKGLCKYNGRTFTYYKNKDQKGMALSGIQEDEKGRIWVRNFKKQIFYVENDSLHRFEEIDKLELNDLAEAVIGPDKVLYLLNRVERLVYRLKDLGSNWEIETFDLNYLKSLGGNTSYFRLHQILTGNGGLYILTTFGLYHLKGEDVSFISNSNLLEDTFADTVAVSNGTLLNNEASLFLLQRSKKEAQLSKLVGNKIEVIEALKNSVYLRDKKLLSLRYLSDGTYWVLTSNGGVVELLFNQNDPQIEGNILFPKEGISDILIDKEGNYWVSSLENGVYIIPKLSIRQTPASDFGITKRKLGVMTVKDSNHFFIATKDEKVLLLNQNQEIKQTYTIPNRTCNHLLWNNEELCASGEQYLCFFNDTNLVDFLTNYPSVKNIYFYKNKILLMATGGAGLKLMSPEVIGVDVFFENTFPSISISENNKWPVNGKSVPHKHCNWVIGDEKHNRFLAAYSDTLICYPEEGASFPVLNEKEELIEATFMEKGAGGLIWICSINRGLYALDKDLKIKYHLTIKNGLISNSIYRLRVSKEGKIWLLGNQGVQSFDPKTKESHIYTIQDGLPTHEIRDIVLVNQKIHLSTAKGLVSFDQEMPSKNEVAPLIYIKNIAIYDRDTILSEVYDLTYVQNSITIEVEGLAYRSRGMFQYKYRMLGIDTVWRYQEGQTNFMRFPQLQSGKYTFEAKIINEDGVESVATRVVFNIGLPYWKTWWFILSIVFFIAIVVFMVVRNQLRQAQLENQNSNLKMEALQSQMNPHFIFNVLTAVQNLWLQHKNELAMDLQSNFAKLLRKIFQYSSKRAITIEQVEDFLNNYLNLEQIRFENEVEIDFKIEEVLLEDDYRVPPLLIQPIIENSFKHGLFHKATDRKLSIHLKQEGAYLYCCVEDNGIGRKDKSGEPKVKRSSGLSTTKERLAILQLSAINAKHPHNNFKITDLKKSGDIPAGTKVELWIPFI
jgi:hypothetical protein